jgi:hypothetical protein
MGGAYGQSLPKRTCPGFAKASRLGNAAGLPESAVSK